MEIEKIKNGEIFAWEGLTCIRLTDGKFVILNARNKFAVGTIYGNVLTIEDSFDYPDFFSAIRAAGKRDIADVITNIVKFPAAFDLYEFKKVLGSECPCCGRSTGGWHNSASAENGKKGGRPARARMICNGVTTILDATHIVDAMAEADKLACYCQSDMIVSCGDEERIRIWCPVRDDFEDQENPIDFGDYGYYCDWQDKTW